MAKYFSERENKIIKILGRKKMTLQEICNELFNKNKPLDGDIYVSNTVRRIIKKCKFYNLNWTLTKIKNGKKLIVQRSKLC